MMLTKAKDIQANFVGHHRHADHLFQALVRTDLLVRVGVRNEFTEGIAPTSLLKRVERNSHERTLL